jgi:hypothetical protein
MSSTSVTVAMTLAALFGVIGVAQLVGPQFLRDAYRRWDYPKRLRLVTGLLDLAVAAMLLMPNMRASGIALAAILIFGSVVTLLNHRHYACAVCAIAMMAALVPAALAVPRENRVQFIPISPQLLAETR